jgi:hypothetical protein
MGCSGLKHVESREAHSHHHNGEVPTGEGLPLLLLLLLLLLPEVVTAKHGMIK